jgi:hypothetical protein
VNKTAAHVSRAVLGWQYCGRLRLIFGRFDPVDDRYVPGTHHYVNR